MVNRRIWPETTSPAALASFAPTALPNSTVTPIVRPVISTVTDCITWLPVATAETLAVGENWPTTARSTPPYRACNSRESIKGSAKRTRGPRMGPDKNILVYFSCVSFIKGKDLLREFGHSCAQTILIISHIAEQTKGHLRKNGGKYGKRIRRKKAPGPPIG